MYLKYEGADFKLGWSESIERHLIKQAIKKKVGKWIGKPYQPDSYLNFATKLLAHLPSSIIVDVGANIGTTVLPLAVKFPSAKFYAVEPHPVPAAKFIRNCTRNQVNNVSLLTAAIGLEGKTAQIYTHPTNSGGHRLTGFSGRKDVEQFPIFGPIAVPMKPLSDVFDDFGISRCNLLKIDTEGYEVFVLESLNDKLQPNTIQHVIAELGPEGLRQAGKSAWDLVSLMLERGYVCRVLGSNKTIDCEKEVPILPDFTVVDLVFSSS